jgi:hypothetical protein
MRLHSHCGRVLFLVSTIATALSGCGGGGGSGGGSATSTDDAALRSQAASATASNNSKCKAIAPFYWEIGDKSGALASGSNGSTYSASTVVQIASASKWIYGSYIVQKRGGVAGLSATDISALTMTSGYMNFSEPPGCSTSTTVGQCAQLGANGTITQAFAGKFFYNGGHMQVHAAANGLAADDNTALAAEINGVLGHGLAVAYSEPQLAGGGRFAAQEYVKLLQSILQGSPMLAALGSNAVCASPNICATRAIYSPAPPTENWSYSLGHWVEDTSNDSDGAFSSPGAFGFYPWIDKTKTYYGVLSRSVQNGALPSVYCGRLIRKAYVTKSEQTG